jgi:hypothetical protein
MRNGKFNMFEKLEYEGKKVFLTGHTSFKNLDVKVLYVLGATVRVTH